MYDSSMKRKGIIEFIDMTNQVPEEFYPKPAKLAIPDWYKKSLSYKNNKKEAYMDDRGFTSSTVKKCMPFFDATTAGYILFSHTDVEVSGSAYRKLFKWPNGNTISWHAKWQLGEFSDIPDGGENIPKWMNPWSIKTLPGYSCLFVNPMNRDKTPFHCFEGIVDTDGFSPQINFPFYLKDNSWEGMIPAGTPIIQVIPFERRIYSHAVYKEKDYKNSDQIFQKQSLIDSFLFNAYKKYFWNKKEYN